jgi:hypothetical protein
MEGLVGAIRYFYEQWILRDVLGYVTPGAILLVVVMGQLIGWESLMKLLRGLPALAFLPIFGLLFIAGFAMQNVGERLGLLRWHDRSSDEQHLKTLYQFHYQNITLENDPRSGAGGWTERTRERISVKKNMSGTALIALILSSIFTLIYQGVRMPTLSSTWKTWATLVLIALLVGLLCWGLFRGHRHQHNNQKIWEDLSMAPEDQASLDAEKKTAG